MKITFLNGELAGSSRELAPPGISIGRETDNDVQILAGGLSRYHAKLEYSNGDWIVRDLGSTNGTKINGERIDSFKTLKGGDIIIIGDQTIRVTDGAAVGQEPPAPQTAHGAASPGRLGHNEQTLEELPLPLRPQGGPFVFQPDPHPASQQEPPPIVKPPSTASQQNAAPSHPHQKSIFDTLRSAVPTKLEGDIFGKTKGSQPGGAASQEPTNGNAKKKGRLGGNLVFYVAVLALAAVCIAIYVKLQQDSAQKASAASKSAVEAPQAPFMLLFEKQRVSKDNVFRFELSVSNGSVVFTLDDLQNNRHFRKSFAKGNPIFLKALEDAVKRSDFMKLQQEAPGVSEDGSDEFKSLTIIQRGDFNKVNVRNTWAKSAFEDIETAIDQFAENFGLKTVSMSVEDMLREAQKAFLKAESLFNNYQASPDSLRNAITRYQLTLDYLDQFEPKPKEWDIARKRQQEARAIQKRLINETTFNYEKNVTLKDYKAAIADCDRMMELCDPDDDLHQRTHEAKLGLEKQLRKMKK